MTPPLLQLKVQNMLTAESADLEKKFLLALGPEKWSRLLDDKVHPEKTLPTDSLVVQEKTSPTGDEVHPEKAPPSGEQLRPAQDLWVTLKFEDVETIASVAALHLPVLKSDHAV